VALAGAAVIAAAFASGAAETDPIAAEIDRWTKVLSSSSSSDEFWKDATQGSQPLLVRAEEALRDGRRLLALYRLSVARESLVAATYAASRASEERKDMAAFEAEWKRVGTDLARDLDKPPPDALASLRPAAVRAFGEAAQHQVRVYYEASLDYGQNTEAQYGLYYLGNARAQRELVQMLRTLPSPGTTKQPPPLRGLGKELEVLEAELLSAYRPPASIDKHREFIGASAAIKMARELDQAGLRYGALLRYLQAVQRAAPLRADAATLDAATLRQRIRDLDGRLAKTPFDSSIGRFFLEVAEAESASSEPQAAATASAVVERVFPRYFAALEPARPSPPAPDPTVTVTLVRWPYT
jgi:hypothetical protein